jgi:hypothetical protein
MRPTELGEANRIDSTVRSPSKPPILTGWFGPKERSQAHLAALFSVSVIRYGIDSVGAMAPRQNQPPGAPST